MKYLKVFIICLVSLLFISGSKKARAFDCPEGYTQYIKTLTLTVDGKTCDYKIWLCVKCDLSPKPLDNVILVNCFGPADDNCLLNINDSFMEAVEAIVLEPNWIADNLCISGFTPCSPLNEPVVVFGQLPMCWQKYNIPNGGIIYEGCMNKDICTKTFEICYDPILGEYVKIPIGNPIQVGNDYDCLQVEPPDPNEGEYSGCFKNYSTDCDIP